jgi:hypothetical protein
MSKKELNAHAGIRALDVQPITYHFLSRDLSVLVLNRWAYSTVTIAAAATTTTTTTTNNNNNNNNNQ